MLSRSWDVVFLGFCYLQYVMAWVCNSASAFKKKKKGNSLKYCLAAVIFFACLDLKI